jgi:hypothetical protein
MIADCQLSIADLGRQQIGNRQSAIDNKQYGTATQT